MRSTDFWLPFEEKITSYAELAAAIEEIFSKWSPKKRIFAWRGHVNAEWPLHSSLFRRLAWTNTSALPEENDLYRYEDRILADVHRWGLHMAPTGGRLSILSQLAALQHYGAPTRLIDITFNPWIGAWFAVEQKWDNGEEVHANADARLFAIDVTGRLINENKDNREWADDFHRPWPKQPSKSSSEDEKLKHRLWCTKVYAWRPPHFVSRIAAQNGGFIFGGVPTSKGAEGPIQWPKGNSNGFWKISEVRSATSVSLRPHKLRVKGGGVSQDAVYTFRITSAAKAEIRDRLQRHFDYRHSTIYPDFTGFASFGTHELKTKP